MSANDAFTAGVRPGGLTSSTEIRLLLCYLVKNAGPITRQEIENALMEEALVNYFEIGSCLDDITKQELVTLTGDSYAEKSRCRSRKNTWFLRKVRSMPGCWLGVRRMVFAGSTLCRTMST